MKFHLLKNIFEYGSFNELKGHDEAINSIAISTDDSTIISGSADKAIRIWLTATGECVRVLEGHSSSVWSVAISADASTIFSGSDDRTIRIWQNEINQ